MDCIYEIVIVCTRINNSINYIIEKVGSKIVLLLHNVGNHKYYLVLLVDGSEPTLISGF